MITSKKALLAGIFDFIAAALCIAALVALWVGIVSGNMISSNTENNETLGEAILFAILFIPLLAPAGSLGLLLATVVAIIGGVKLLSHARGRLVSHKLFVLALVLKLVGLLLACIPVLAIFEFSNIWGVVIVYIAALAFLLFASIFEACVRKSP